MPPPTSPSCAGNSRTCECSMHTNVDRTLLDTVQPCCSWRPAAHSTTLESIARFASTCTLHGLLAALVDLNDGQGRCPASIQAGGGGVRLPTVSPVDSTLFGASTRRRFASRDRCQRQRLDPLPLRYLCFHCGHRRRARYLPPKRPTTATAMPSPRSVAEALLADAQARGEVFTVGAGQRQRWQTRQPWARLMHAL